MSKKYKYGIIILALIIGSLAVFSACSNKKDNKEPVEPTTVEPTTETPTEEPTTPPDVTINGVEYAYNTEYIDLRGTEIASASELAESLNRLQGYLKEVDLTDVELTVDDKVLLMDVCKDVHFIWSVDLCGVVINHDTTEADISGKTIENFEEFKKKISLLPQLTYLDMCDCGLTNAQMEELQAILPDTKFVWKITMGLWTIRTDAVAFSTLKDGTIYYRLTNEDTQVLKYCTDMVALDIGHNKVTDLSFLQYMPNLKILILVDNWDGETDEHYIKDLSMLRYVPKLVYLEFFVGDVSDISFLQYLPNLVDLNISYNPISDVSYLLNLPKIERLWLEHTNLTEDDYKLLCDTYPDATVVYYGTGSVDQGWRTHERYWAMKDMYVKNYVHELFMD